MLRLIPEFQRQPVRDSVWTSPKELWEVPTKVNSNSKGLLELTIPVPRFSELRAGWEVARGPWELPGPVSDHLKSLAFGERALISYQVSVLRTKFQGCHISLQQEANIKWGIGTVFVLVWRVLQLSDWLRGWKRNQPSPGSTSISSYNEDQSEKLLGHLASVFPHNLSTSHPWVASKTTQPPKASSHFEGALLTVFPFKSSLTTINSSKSKDLMKRHCLCDSVL